MICAELIVAWFLILFVPNQEFPVLIGPYLDKQDCDAVKDYEERQGRVTGGCSEMSLPQEATDPEDNGLPYQPVMKLRPS